MSEYPVHPSVKEFLAHVGGGSATDRAGGAGRKARRRAASGGTPPEWAAVGRRVAARRKARLVSSYGLARDLGVSHHAYRDWEGGRRPFPADVLPGVALRLRCKITDLTGGTEPCE